MNKNEIKSPISEEEIKRAISDLGSERYGTREAARKVLTTIGKPAIDFLAELIVHPKRIYRWESVKTLVQLNDPVTIPLLLLAFYDDDSDIRWLAGEGLIHLGSISFVPVLESLMKDSDSIYVREATYHVLHHLRDKFPFRSQLNKLLSYLGKNGEEVEASAQAAHLVELLNTKDRRISEKKTGHDVEDLLS